MRSDTKILILIGVILILLATLWMIYQAWHRVPPSERELGRMYDRYDSEGHVHSDGEWERMAIASLQASYRRRGIENGSLGKPSS